MIGGFSGAVAAAGSFTFFDRARFFLPRFSSALAVVGPLLSAPFRLAHSIEPFELPFLTRCLSATAQPPPLLIWNWTRLPFGARFTLSATAQDSASDLSFRATLGACFFARSALPAAAAVSGSNAAATKAAKHINPLVIEIPSLDRFVRIHGS